MSKGLYNSKGINWSYGVNSSKGVHGSNGVNWSNGVNYSNGVHGSKGVNYSYGVSLSDGVNSGYGVSWSDGVNYSNGVNCSYGILTSSGVHKAIFLKDHKPKPTIFGQEVTEERFDEVLGNIHEKANGWFPKFNNAFELYAKAGSDWRKVKASEICSTLDNWREPYEAWKDMPKELLEYIKSLPEFDAEDFKAITGIDVTEPETMIEINGKKWSASTIQQALKNYVEE